jgi:hypothetical protein
MKELSLKKKVQKIRKKLRLKGVLPAYGEFLTPEQTIIWKQLNEGDFSYWEQFKREEFKKNEYKKKDPTEYGMGKNTKKRRSYIRGRLRDMGLLPPLGEPSNEEQKKILDQINVGDFSYYLEQKRERTIDKERKCTVCGDTDEMNFYPKRKSICKECLLLDLKKKYRDGELVQNVKKNKLWASNNFIHTKVLYAKHRALRKNFEFELTDKIIEDKLKEQDGKCFITGMVLTFTSHDWRSMSFDRVDPNIGYTVKNTILVTRFVNIAKNTMSEEEFIEEVRLCHEGIVNKHSL